MGLTNEKSRIFLWIVSGAVFFWYLFIAYLPHCDEEVMQDDDKLSKIRGEMVGMIFQGFHLLPMLTVEENILMPGRFAGKKTNEKDVKELIEKLSLSGREKHLPSELSGGQQQRVGDRTGDNKQIGNFVGG